MAESSSESGGFLFSKYSAGSASGSSVAADHEEWKEWDRAQESSLGRAASLDRAVSNSFQDASLAPVAADRWIPVPAGHDPGVFLHKYHLLKPLDGGKFGSVCDIVEVPAAAVEARRAALARDVNTVLEADRAMEAPDETELIVKVGVKHEEMLPADVPVGAVKRQFQHEVDVMTKLKREVDGFDRYFPELLEVYEDRDRVYLVMKKIKGKYRNLPSEVEKKAADSWYGLAARRKRFGLKYVVNMLQVMQVFHKAGFAHGDNHGRNWMFTGPPDDDDTRLLLIDFGNSQEPGAARYKKKEEVKEDDEQQLARKWWREDRQALAKLIRLMNADREDGQKDDEFEWKPKAFTNPTLNAVLDELEKPNVLMDDVLKVAAPLLAPPRPGDKQFEKGYTGDGGRAGGSLDDGDALLDEDLLLPCPDSMCHPSYADHQRLVAENRKLKAQLREIAKNIRQAASLL